MVYCGNEEIEAVTLHTPRVEEHALLLHLRGVVKAGSNLEDLALGSSRSRWTLQVDEDDTLEMALITLTYRMKYHIHADAPGCCAGGRIQQRRHGKALVGLITLTYRMKYQRPCRCAGLCCCDRASMSETSKTLHETLIRAAKMALAAWEKWLAGQTAK